MKTSRILNAKSFTTMSQHHIHYPAICALSGSLLLSLIAIYFNPILARDSTLYVDIAGAFVSEGFANPTGRFDWPWLAVMIAVIHNVTGFTLIVSGHLLMATLMAGTCALLTRATQLLNPAAAWWGCLASLSLPAFNAYRDSILREPGFWMFSALSLLAVGLWAKHPGRDWRYLALTALSIIAAMLFRLEAVFLFGALTLTVMYGYVSSSSRRKIFWLLGACGLLLLLFVVTYSMIFDAIQNERVNYYLQLLNPGAVLTRLEASASVLAENILQKYSHDDATLILIFGFTGVILWNSAKLLGPYVITLAFAGRGLIERPVTSMSVFVLCAIGLYLLVLLIFFTQQGFMIDRYTALIHILAMPLIALSAWQFSERYPIAGKILAAIAILVALSNVVSLSDKRTHYFPAAEWIERNIPVDSRTYYADGRISFYAGRGYQISGQNEKDALGAQFGNYDYFVLESAHDSELLKLRIEADELKLLARFSNGGRRQLIILGKPADTQD
jgi:hypothetical protein